MVKGHQATKANGGSQRMEDAGNDELEDETVDPKTEDSEIKVEDKKNDTKKEGAWQSYYDPLKVNKKSCARFFTQLIFFLTEGT